jgi:hypothetical protein
MAEQVLGAHDDRDSRAIGKIFDAIDRITAVQAEQGSQIRVIESTMKDVVNAVSNWQKSRQVSPSLIVSIVGSGVIALGIIIGGIVALTNYNIAGTVNPLAATLQSTAQAIKDQGERLERIAGAINENNNTVAALSQFSTSGLARVETQFAAISQLRNQETAHLQAQLCDLRQERTPGYNCPPYIYFPMIGSDSREPSTLRRGFN